MFNPEQNFPSPEEEKERVTKEALEDGKFTYYLVKAAEEVRERWQEEELTPEEEEQVLGQIKENYLERMKEQGLLKEDQEEAFGERLKETALNKTGGSIVVNSEEKEGGDVIGNREGFLNRERYFKTIEGIKENPEDDIKEWKQKLEEGLYGETQLEVGLKKHIEGFGRAALEEEDLKTAAESLSRKGENQENDFSEKLKKRIKEARSSENEEVKEEAEEAAKILEEAQTKED